VEERRRRCPANRVAYSLINVVHGIADNRAVLTEI
jgi:hypothetical protein